MTGYTELQVCSNYSFLRGASRIEELMLQAKALGYDALAVTDHNTLAGIARAHARAKEVGIRLVVGCRLELTDGLPVLAYPTDRPAYARLCRLLTLAKSRGGKGSFELGWKDLAAAGGGLVLVLLPDMPDVNLEGELRRMRTAFPGRCLLALGLRRRPGDTLRLRELSDTAQRARVPTVITGEVLYHAPQRRILQDVVTCIREGCTIDGVGYRRERFADRHLKSPEEMARLFAACRKAVARFRAAASSCCTFPWTRWWNGWRPRVSRLLLPAASARHSSFARADARPFRRLRRSPGSALLAATSIAGQQRRSSSQERNDTRHALHPDPRRPKAPRAAPR